MRERQKLDSALGAVRSLENELADATGLIEMAEAENDAAMVADAESAITAIAAKAEKQRLQSMLSGEANAAQPAEDGEASATGPSTGSAPPASVSEGTGGLY